MLRSALSTTAALLLAVLVLASCDSGDEAPAADGKTLTIYGSFPLQGALRDQSLAIANGVKLALKQHDNRVGDFKLRYVQLDDSTPQAGTWTPEATSANARRAVQDDTAIGYLGESNSGASAISIPILNEGGLAQVSATNTAVGLTSDEPGADAGEPDKYYPAGKRTFARVAPKDTIQGAAIATLMKADGCANVYIVNDEEVYGAGLARNIESAAESQGIEVLANDGIDPRAPNYRSLAAKLESAGTDCFVFGGTSASNAAQLYKDVAVALPDAKLYGPDGVSDASFRDPKGGGVPPEVSERVKVTVATLAPEEYPPEGQKFFEAFEAEYGEEHPDPYAIYGYESAQLLLDAIRRAGQDGDERTAVVEALMATEDRKSALGTYSIDENGDITLTDYGVYRIEDGELVFDRTISAQR